MLGGEGTSFICMLGKLRGEGISPVPDGSI